MCPRSSREDQSAYCSTNGACRSAPSCRFAKHKPNPTTVVYLAHHAKLHKARESFRVTAPPPSPYVPMSLSLSLWFGPLPVQRRPHRSWRQRPGSTSPTPAPIILTTYVHHYTIVSNRIQYEEAHERALHNIETEPAETDMFLFFLVSRP